MINWRRGQVVVTRNRIAKEGSLDEFLDGLARAGASARAVARCRGLPEPQRGHHPAGAPCTRSSTPTRSTKRVLIVSVDTVSIPHVDDHDRFAVEKLGPRGFNVATSRSATATTTSSTSPAALRACRKQGLLERDLDLEHASYFVSRITITPTDAPTLQSWRKRLFIAMARNAASPIDHFGLPSEGR